MALRLLTLPESTDLAAADGRQQRYSRIAHGSAKRSLDESSVIYVGRSIVDWQKFFE
jgi:hypothetical protein